MRRYVFGLLLAASFLPAAVFAADCATEDGGAPLNGQCTTLPNNFVQTINEIRLLRDNGNTTYTFVDIPITAVGFDFASVSAGQAIGDVLANSEIPDGTYVAFSPIIDNFATLNAEVTVDGMQCRTDSTGISTAGGSGQDYTYDFTLGSPFVGGTDGGYDFGTADDEEEWLNGSDDLVIVKKFPTPVVFSAGNQPDVTIEMAVDAAGAAAFSFNGAACQEVNLGELQVTFTVTSN